MALTSEQIDVIYLALYGLAAVLKLAAGGLVTLGFIEGLVYAIQILRG